MAVSKIHAIKSTVGKAVDYITNEVKTVLEDGTKLVSSYKCVPETAAIEFQITEDFAIATKGDYSKCGGSNVLAYHLIQSFSVDDNKKVTPEQIHELGKEFAKRFLGDKYEYVLATHIDKKHVHNHIIFNSTSFVDNKKFRSQPYKTVAKIREISDKICEENDLSVIKTYGIGKSYKEHLIHEAGKLTWKDVIKNAVDTVIPKVRTFNEFVAEMNKLGIEVKDGKHIAFRCPSEGQERFIRGKRIGENYIKLNILKRINNIDISIPPTLSIDLGLIYKTLNDGFFVRLPHQKCLVHLDGKTAHLEQGRLSVNLINSEYTLYNSGLLEIAKVSPEQVKSLLEAATQDNRGELPLEEYLKLRRTAAKDQLHRAAEAIAYCRTEGVLYYADFDRRIRELKDEAYDTKHSIIDVENSISNIKEVGRYLVAYQKYKPYYEEMQKFRFANIGKRKYAAKYNLELLSFEAAKENLERMGIAPERIDQAVLIEQIKNAQKSVKSLETAYEGVLGRIERLDNSRSIIKDFVSGDAPISHERSPKIKKKDIEL